MPHGEAITIGDNLTLLDDDGNVVFRPTVYFVYCPCDYACASIKEVEAKVISHYYTILTLPIVLIDRSIAK